MHYYQFNVGDYRRDTSHLTLLEHGIYRSLLDSYYLNEKPLCGDDAELMRTHSIRTDEEKNAFKNIMKDFFIFTKKGYIQSKCEKQILKYNEKSEKARASAKVRWDAKAMRTHSKGNTNDMLTNNQEPITNNQEPNIKKIDQSEINQYFDQFWSSGIRKVNKKKSLSLFSSILKKTKDQGWGEFTEILIEDVKSRIASKQLGFSEMHPTTYLNNERWKDEIIKSTQKQPLHDFSNQEYTEGKF